MYLFQIISQQFKKIYTPTKNLQFKKIYILINKKKQKNIPKQQS